MNSDAAEVLAFWFDEATNEQRFARDDAFDRKIRDRFAALHARLSVHVPDDWLTNPESLLAAIIVLDQFSRNLYRDDPRAYAADACALNLARLALRRGHEALLDGRQRQFLHMPFMHSEDADDQDRSVELFGEIGDEAALDFARRHKAIIDRFGRFPHRNAVLGRRTTDEEAAFLRQPGSSF